MSIRRLSRIALFAALCVVLREAFAPFPNIKPITAFYFLLIEFEDLKTSILVMILSIFLSSFLFGMGPWVLLQIMTFALVIYLWHLVVPYLKRAYQPLLAFSLAFLYGLIIDSVSAFLFQMPWWTYVTVGLGFDFNHAMSTFVFYPILYLILRRFYDEKNI